MEWKKVSICELCDSMTETYRGHNSSVVLINTSDVLDGKCLNHKLVPNKNLKGQFKKTFKQGDILYSEIRPANRRFAYVDFDSTGYIASTKLMVLRAKKGVNPDFLYQILRSNSVLEQLQMLAESRSGTFPQITYSEMANVIVNVPSLEEQDKIVSILSSLDAQIENNNRINANLEAQAQALFKSWFVDFEPWGGVMPEDWKEGKLGDIVQMLNGFAFKSDCFTEEGKYQLITIKGVQDGFLTTESAVKINDIPEKMPTWCLLEKGDILLSLTGNVGRCCYVDRDNLLLNQRVAKVKPLQEYNRMFVYAMFRTETMKSRMIGLARGTAQANLSPIETSNLEILIPSEEVLKKFGEKCSGILNQMINNTETNLRLAALRDTLLPKLMKGEIEL